MPRSDRKRVWWGTLPAVAAVTFGLCTAWLATGPVQYRVNPAEVRVVEAAFAGARRPNASDPVVPLGRQRGAFGGSARQFHASVPSEALPSSGPLAAWLPDTGGASELFVNSVPVGSSESGEELRAVVPGGLLLDGANRFDLRVEPGARKLLQRLWRADAGPVYLGPDSELAAAARRVDRVERAVRALALLAALLCLLAGLVSLARRRAAGVGLLVVAAGAGAVAAGAWAVPATALAASGFAPLLWRTSAVASPLESVRARTAWTGIVAAASVVVIEAVPVWRPEWGPGETGATAAVALLAAGAGGTTLQEWVQDLRRRARATAEQLQRQALTITEQDRAIREAVAREAVLEERQRFTRDMHDGVGAQLTSLLLRLRAGRADLPTVEAEVEQGLADLRLVVDSLDRVGTDLGEALEAFRSRAEQQAVAAGLGFEWSVKGKLGPDRLGEEAILHLYRSLQEVLSNALRHSGANRIAFAFEEVSGELEIHVADNGRGFETATARRGRGLRSLAERAGKLGADLSVRSAPGDGTEVEMRVPLRTAAARVPTQGYVPV